VGTPTKKQKILLKDKDGIESWNSNPKENIGKLASFHSTALGCFLVRNSTALGKLT